MAVDGMTWGSWVVCANFRLIVCGGRSAPVSASTAVACKPAEGKAPGQVQTYAYTRQAILKLVLIKTTR